MIIRMHVTWFVIGDIQIGQEPVTFQWFTNGCQLDEKRVLPSNHQQITYVF